MKPGLLMRWLFLTVAILLTSYLIDGIRIEGFFSAIFAAAILGILNAILRPILFVLTLPITILTLGLFTFVINAVLLKTAAALIPGFDVIGFWPAVFGSLLISIVSWVLNSFLIDRGGGQNGGGGGQNDRRDVHHIDLKRTDDDHWE